jgi:hypothetical protein
MPDVLEPKADPRQTPILPYWFKQRQGKTEPAANGVFKLTAPQLEPAWITIRQAQNGLWSGHLLADASGPDISSTPPLYDTIYDAWNAAFELQRIHLVV